MIENPTILIAGASGYIGTAVIPALLSKFPQAKIVALSRTTQEAHDPRVIWKGCDLFSLKALDEACPERIDLAIYLVHSMGPTAQLDQGSFADYDLILADNFARVLSKRSVQQLIYLGGLIPQEDKLSTHLQSRLEMEETFREYNLPTTVFRAGLIIGEQGSSFQILLKLVKRLPVMICPHWTQTLTTPVDLQTVVAAITESSLKTSELGKSYDLCGCKPLTYVEMMQTTAIAAGQKRLFIPVPFFTPTLSRLWVTLITQTPKNLVYPLIESLEHKMVAREGHLHPACNFTQDYSELLKKTKLKTLSSVSIFRFKAQRKTVRSVQRLHLPKNQNAEWVKEQYISWLPQFLNPLIRVYQEGSLISFSLFGKNPVMLQLDLSSQRSHEDRQLLYIRGGLLVSAANQGRLEFRVVLNRKYIIAAIHDYRPALPWFFYRYTQALLHLFVMRAFDRHLRRQG
jgi:uncharacterized protein YbjT (DUF2867 family)